MGKPAHAATFLFPEAAAEAKAKEEAELAAKAKEEAEKATTNGKVTLKYSMYTEVFDLVDGKLKAAEVDDR